MSLARTCGALVASCLIIGGCAAPWGATGYRAAQSSSTRRSRTAPGLRCVAATVRIVGDRIERIGAIEPQSNDTVIDARGLVLAPGFIDMHNHSDEALEKQPLAESQIAQGITSIVLGLDGGSPYPVGPWLEARRRDPAALNLTLMVGHATVREQVMQKDFRRVATRC